MKDLKKLTTIDLSLLFKVEEINNSKKPILETNIPLLYDKLFVDYSKNDCLESLKRAIFIQWYSISEPSNNTGIGALNSEYQKENLLRVEKLIITKSIDSEFLEMIYHYYEISDWYFNSILSLKPLFDLKSRSINNIVITTERGIMGKYWRSILNG